MNCERDLLGVLLLVAQADAVDVIRVAVVVEVESHRLVVATRVAGGDPIVDAVDAVVGVEAVVQDVVAGHPDAVVLL
jgi:hypothetical protein